MTRADFMSRLKAGLVGLPTTAAADILNDYHAHFDDGRDAGRSEAEVAAALGDPDRLARELKAEAGVQRWRQEQTPSAAAGAVFAVLGLGAIDILILLPLLMGVIGTLFGFFVAVIAVFFAGGVVMVTGPFAGFPGGGVAAFLAGLGLMAGSVAVVGGPYRLVSRLPRRPASHDDAAGSRLSIKSLSCLNSYLASISTMP
ncbi:DUF1700 domain-containing protein [Brevundimonas sp.]|uniref:DUF1700 domain-containing protein n=1 Tax=Brevundimonas sp. TaxID=1871086 RepID=UPI001A3542F1|nr:DUF1700 domain-containing protein [Brevundimonas sp.]MBJ7486125.1 DUF1700 domain-containing protein [Brevundimonas sp.]